MKEITHVPITTLRRAALDAGVDERTAAKVALGIPGVRPAGRERVLAALQHLGVDVAALPSPTNQTVGTLAMSAAATTTTTKGLT